MKCANLTGTLLRFRHQRQCPVSVAELVVNPTEISGCRLCDITCVQLRRELICSLEPVDRIIETSLLKRCRTHVEEGSGFEKFVMFGAGKCKTLIKVIAGLAEPALFNCQNTPRTQYCPAGRVPPGRTNSFRLSQFTMCIGELVQSRIRHGAES